VHGSSGGTGALAPGVETRRIQLRLGGILVALVLMAVPSAAVAQRLGYVDFQRAMGETGEGRAAQGRLKRLVEKRQGDLEGRQKRLERMAELIKGDVLAPEAKGKRIEAYREELVEFQAKSVEYQREISKRELEETGRAIERMRKILVEIGDNQDYTSIVEVNEGGVVYAKRSLDVTNQLIRLYDERHPARSKRARRGSSKRGKSGRARAAPAKAPAKAAAE